MKQLIPALFTVGALMVLVGAAVYITKWEYAPYIYTIGAGALALVLTGAFMFFTHGNDWIACLTIAAILELYTAFRIQQEEAKEK